MKEYISTGKNIDVAINLIKASLYIKTATTRNFDEAILTYKQRIESENKEKTMNTKVL